MAATKQAQIIKKETKEYITIALLEMLTKEKLSVLNVSQVCKYAGVSRMAFYRNFSGLEQILYEYYQPKIASVFTAIRQNEKFSNKHDIQIDFFKVFSVDLLKSIDRGFEQIIQQIFIDEIKGFYKLRRDEYWVAFMAAGVYAIWKKWLLDGRKIPLVKIMLFLKQFDTLVGIDFYSTGTSE